MPDIVELVLQFEPEASSETKQCTVSVTQAGGALSAATFAFEPPVEGARLADLSWYLETFHDWPTEQDYRRAARIEAELIEWGQTLLERVRLAGNESHPEALKIWKRFVEAETGERRITIESFEPDIARLPWELLADHNGFLFSQAILIQRRLGEPLPAATPLLGLPLRVLHLACRPEDAPFSDPRLVSKALMEAVDGLEQELVVEQLYPPTFEALRERLAVKERPVSVVHFDGHCEGAFRQGFLLFEDASHQTDSIDTETLGSLLMESDVRLVVLNAAAGTTRTESAPCTTVSLGLLSAGVPNVVSMNYAMLPEAMSAFAQGLYGGLLSGLSVAQAADNGRRILFSGELSTDVSGRHSKRVLAGNGTRLSDWFLPTVHQSSVDSNLFSGVVESGGFPRTAEDLPPPLVMTEPSFPGSLPAEPLYGFHGRSRELQRLARTFATDAVVFLTGHAGSGKTALAAEAGRWLFRTGRFPGGVVYVSFDRGGSLNLLCLRVGQAATNDPEFTFKAANGANPVDQISRLLEDNPMLVILDHFESVTRPRQLIQHGELDVLMEAVWSWCRPSEENASKVLISTGDSADQLGRFVEKEHAALISLQGMTRRDTLELAAAILDKHGIDRTTVDHRALADLADHVGGHPASLGLILPLLRFWVPARLSASLETLLPGFTTGAARLPQASLKVTLDFYLRRLGDDVLRDMPALAVFRDGAMEAEILWITRMDPDLWQVVSASLAEASLITLEALPGIGPPFIRFHAALAGYLEDHLSVERRQRLEEAYWRRYFALAKHLHAHDARFPRQTRSIALREMPNILHAAEILAATGRLKQAEELAHYVSPFLKSFGRDIERDAIVAQLDLLRRQAALASAASELPNWTESLVATVVQAIKGGDNASEAASEFLSRLEKEQLASASRERVRGDGEGQEPVLSAGQKLFGEEVARDIASRLAAITPEIDLDVPLDESDLESEPLHWQGSTAADAVIAAHIREEWELVIQTVADACRGDQDAAADLPPLLDQMSRDEDWRELSRAIALIIGGQREPDTLMSKLDSIDAIIVAEILSALSTY